MKTSTLVKENYEPISWSENDEIFIEGCKIKDIASEFGTPLNIISETQLRNNARLFQKVFSDNWKEGTVRILPAIKANFTLALRNILTEEGCGCDTFSYGELTAALQSGIDPYMISLNGNGKLGDEKILREAVELGVRITIDTPDEFEIIEEIAKEIGKKANIRFRLRPEYRELSYRTQYLAEPMSVEFGTQMYKQGIPTEHLISLGRHAIESPHFNVTGVHMHLGRNRRDSEYWADGMRGYARMIGRLKKEWGGWEPDEIDIGGGIPCRRDPNCQVDIENDVNTQKRLLKFYEDSLKASHIDDGSDRHKITDEFLSEIRSYSAEKFKQNPLKVVRPALNEYAEAITCALREELNKNGISTEGKILEIEPGRGMYGDAGIHIASVTALKTQKEPITWNWLNCNTVETFLLNTSYSHALFRYMFDGYPIQKQKEEDLMVSDIVGSSCNFDRLVPDALIPKKMKAGDLVVFIDTAAYNVPMSGNFNAIPRPGMVLVSENKVELIKRSETQEDVFSRDIIPDRLKNL